MAAVTGFMVLWLWFMRDRLGLKPYMTVLIGVPLVILGLASVWVFALAEAGFQPEKAGNMSLYGEVFLMPPVFLLLAKLLKRDAGTVFDILVVCVCFSLLCGRINCLLTGCCRGTLIPGTELRWPVREIEIAFYLIFLEVSVFRNRKKKAHGELYPVYMIAYGALRFVLEFVRETDGGGVFHIAHLWSAVSVAAGLTALLILRKTIRKGV